MAFSLGPPSTLPLCDDHDSAHPTAPAASNLSLSLSLVKSILDATDTLPCVKYVASVGVTIIEVVQEVQSNKTACQNLALRAQDMIVTIAKACRGVSEDGLEAQLKDDLRQLTVALEDVLEFTRTQLSRKVYKRLLYKSEDADNIKSLEDKLTHAFRMFEVQSSVSMRQSLRLISQQIEELHEHGQSHTLPKDQPLSILDGIYIIKNASTDKLLELANAPRTMRWAPVYLTSQRELSEGRLDLSQLWSVTTSRARQTQYIITNLASGTVLDILCAGDKSGTRVGCYPHAGFRHQLWKIFGSRRSNVADLCTIRSCGPPTVLDAASCPVSAQCESLHSATFDPQSKTQEWIFAHIPIPYHTPPSESPSISPALPASPRPLSHRLFYLQNISSGLFVTRAIGPGEDGFRLTATHSSSSLWYFFHSCHRAVDYPHFAILSSSATQTCEALIEQKIGDHVRTAYYSPKHDYHHWQPIPRADRNFSFRNRGSGALLAEGPGQVLSTVASDGNDNQSCLWRVVYADSSANSTQPRCSVVYDSTLTFPPLSLFRPTSQLSDSFLTTSLSVGTDRPTLRVEEARNTSQAGFAASLDKENGTLFDLVDTGYTSFVIVPQIVFAAKLGRCTVLRLTDEERIMKPRQFRQAGDGRACG